MEKGTVFSKNDIGTTAKHCSRCKKIAYKPHTLYKTSLKIDHRSKYKTIKPFEEIWEETYMTLGLAMSSQTRHQKHTDQKIANWYFLKIKNFCPVKDMAPKE